MIRTTIHFLFAAGSLLAATAHAEGIVVKIAGQDPATIHRNIVVAAEKLCAAPDTSPMRLLEFPDTCIADTVAQAMRQIGDAEPQARTASR